MSFRLEFDDVLVDQLNVTRLPKGWNASPPGLDSMSIGDEWLKRARTCVLAVPSVIVPSELNYLINPDHSDFVKIKISKPQPFAFDPRLL